MRNFAFRMSSVDAWSVDVGEGNPSVGVDLHSRSFAAMFANRSLDSGGNKNGNTYADGPGKLRSDTQQ